MKKESETRARLSCPDVPWKGRDSKEASLTLTVDGGELQDHDAEQHIQQHDGKDDDDDAATRGGYRSKTCKKEQYIL